MKLLKGCCLLMWMIILQQNCNAKAPSLVDVEVLYDERTLDLIISKLDEINAKVDLLNIKSTESEIKLESLSRKVHNLERETQSQNSNLNRKSDLILNHNTNYEEDHHRIVSLLNDSKQEINSTQENIKQSLSKIEALSNLVSNIQQSQLESLSVESKSLQNSIVPFINQMNNGFSDYLASFASCEQALNATGKSGVYSLFMPNTGLPPFKAYCLLDPYEHGIGFTVIQERKDGSVSFEQKWHAYKHGFGDPAGEHWLGLEKVYAMTSKQNYELFVEVKERSGKRIHIHRGTFEIGSEAEKYYLKSNTWYDSKNAGTSVSRAGKLLRFTTFDEDNDTDDTQNCAIKNKSAWWYSFCELSSLNGIYSDLEYGQKYTGTWLDCNATISYTRMAIRPSHKTYIENI